MQVLINDLLDILPRRSALFDARDVDLDATLDAALANLETAIEESGARSSARSRCRGSWGTPPC